MWARKGILRLDPLRIGKIRNRNKGAFNTPRKLKKWKQVFPGSLEPILAGMEGMASMSGSQLGKEAVKAFTASSKRPWTRCG